MYPFLLCDVDFRPYYPVSEGGCIVTLGSPCDRFAADFSQRDLLPLGREGVVLRYLVLVPVKGQHVHHVIVVKIIAVGGGGQGVSHILSRSDHRIQRRLGDAKGAGAEDFDVGKIVSHITIVSGVVFISV